ncbi:MAG: hypothetical protein AAGJ81_08125 [Verrucomicrobiota bacterium]
MPKKKTTPSPTRNEPVELTFDRAKATAVKKPYRHPSTGRTVFYKQGVHAFTATGVYAGRVRVAVKTSESAS